MKISLIALLLTVSTAALFAGNVPVPPAPYSNISQYPVSIEPGTFPDKEIELHWDEETWNKAPELSGKSKITLKRGQGLVLSIQNPNAVHFLEPIGSEAIEYTEYYFVNKHLSYFEVHTEFSEPWYKFFNTATDVLSGGGSDEIDKKTDIEPIVFNFRAEEASAGTQRVTIYVDERGSREEYFLSGRYNIAYPLKAISESDTLLKRYSFTITVTVE
ncbi:MAG: hypothetical protein ACH346_00650 [Chthoniobacterales bacterium]